MKKLILLLLFFHSIIQIESNIVTVKRVPQHFNVERFLPQEKPNFVINLNYTKINGTLEKFMYDFGKKESSNNPDTINKIGYIGRFQFGTLALLDVGYDLETISKFRENPKLFTLQEQNEAFLKLLKNNARVLKNVINQYDLKIIDGVLITKSGILAAAHLAGAQGVINYFNKQTNKRDNNGTSIQDYLKLFSNYQI